jgi:hypothetical protein
MLQLSKYFLSPEHAMWFWMLVPFILLYLIKPKPMNQTIPSLMFLLQDKGQAFRNSFLRYLYRDFVFFLQLLILTLLVAAACQPFLSVPKTSLVNNAVIVLDASASMQTDDGRWNDALNAAEEHLARQNTIILVLNRPYIIAAEVSKGDAQAVLDRLKPFDTETNLYSAIMASKNYAPDADSTVTIISDFRNSDEQQDYRAAIKTVQATGATVNLVQVGKEVRNVGITSLVVEESKTRIGLTNFNTEATAVDLQVGDLEQTVPLGPQVTDYVTIATPPSTTEVTIDANDDFALDDTAMIVNNEDLTVQILIVTNDPNIKQTPFWYSLQAIDEQTPLTIQTDITNPPALTDIDHDIVVFYNVNSQLLVQRTVRETANAVRGGKAAIILYQPDLFQIDFEGMLPYSYEATGGATGILQGEFSPIIKDIDFGDVQHYHKVTGTGRVLAQAADNTPLVSVITLGKGKVLYYGIDDTTASFPQEPYYPVFWKRVLDELGGRVTPESLNYHTGAVPLFTAVPKETPDDFRYNGFLDKQGLYTYEDRVVAANLLSIAESTVSVEALPEQLVQSTQSSSQESFKQEELTSLILLAVLILLFLELFIVKYRGDF